MNDLVMMTRDGDVGVLTVNNPPVNALSPGVPEGIVAGVEAFQKDATIRAIVLIGGGRTFIAGADIKEFGKITSGQKREDIGLRTLLQTLEDCPKPVIAAIHGTAFGGGLETAMACHYRVGVAAAQVGQPEVKLGLIPGAGGTQRLPRLAGVAKAAEMCATGEPVKATGAFEAGILDRVVDGDLLQGAVALAREVADRGGPPRKTRDRDDKLGDRAAALQALQAVREAVRKRTRGLMAPGKAFDAVEAAVTLPFADGVVARPNSSASASSPTSPRALSTSSSASGPSPRCRGCPRT
jgi:3-hydroxyacyl-CoA dehydrogenase